MIHSLGHQQAASHLERAKPASASLPEPTAPPSFTLPYFHQPPRDPSPDLAEQHPSLSRPSHAPTAVLAAVGLVTKVHSRILVESAAA